MVHIFHFLLTSLVFEIVNPFSWIFNAIAMTKVAWFQLDVRTLEFFPPAESWLVNSNFPRASRMQGVLFISKIRDREKGIIVIYSFYTWFSFLTWVWDDTFLEIVSSKTATTQIFQSGVRNWPAGVSRREIEVFNPQAWDSRLRCESWQA